jgi:peptidoglycan/LPS O-acetylase OafA/YrhL
MNLSLIPDPDHWFISFGWMGVDLFFVLSGFLIASQLLKPWAIGSTPQYSRFFARRVLRTAPAFAVVLLIYFAFPVLREFPDIQPFWQFPTFTENLLFEPIGPKAFSHVWSLCVEEQFYLVFPLVVALVAMKPSFRKTVAVLVVTLFAGVALRSYLWLAHVAETPFDAKSDPNWHTYLTHIYYPTWSRLDGLLAGIGLATLKIFRPAVWTRFVSRPNLLLGAGLVGIGLSILLFGRQIAPLLPAAIGFPLLSASIALIVAAASTGKAVVGKYRIWGGQALATGAYSLYLSQKIAYHATAKWIAPVFGATGYATLLLAMLMALAAGALLYWIVERPFLRLRDRWEGRSRTTIAVDAAAPR